MDHTSLDTAAPITTPVHLQLERGIITKSSFIKRIWNHEEEESTVVVDLRKCFQSAFNILNPLGPYSEVWKGVFLLSSAIALWLDPLFFYIITVNEDKKCLYLDRKLGIATVGLRWSIDFIHIIYIACRLLTDFFFALLCPQGDVDRDAWNIVRRYLLSFFFLIDILAILPLPQVLVLLTPAMRGSRVLVAMDVLKFFVISQFVPRILRLYPFYTRGKRAFGELAEAAWFKALLNLFLYMLASHVIGALWYCLAIERETKCWREACGNQPGCVAESLICDATPGNHTFLNDLCPISSSNTEQFDFGIYLYALESDIVKGTNFLQKFLHCFRWGIQNLSSCGQNLQTSVYIWENVFAVFITISGLLSLLLLIGNVLIFLQSKTMRHENKRLKKLEEKRLRVHKVKQWQPFKKLSAKLQKKVIENQECITRDLDLENLLQNLPQKLSTKIKRELCFDLLCKVPRFWLKGTKFLETLCDHVKPVVYSKNTIIIQKEEGISNMLFIVQGKLKIQDFAPDNKTISFRGDGEIFGEQLQHWVFSGGTFLQKTNILVRALTMVEAFVLESDDLESNWAAMVVQSAWRLRKRRKLRGIIKEAVEREERRLWPRIVFETTDSKGSQAALAKWEPFKKLSGALQWKVKDYVLYKLQEIRDVDLVMLLHKLPKELSTKMKDELCFDLLNKVEAFSLTGRKLLDALCFCAKPVLFMEGCLFREGDTVGQMLFIVRGKLQTFSTSSGNRKVYLKGGDFCGEELVLWVQDPESLHLPVSSRTIRALTKVEAFALQSSDLKRNWEAVRKQAAAHVISALLRKRFQEGKHSLALGHAESTTPEEIHVAF